MIIVTGGAGFIGSAIVWKLNNEGIDDIIVVDELGTSEKWKNLVKLRYRDYIHKDDFLDMILEDDVPFPVSGIIHMGACSSTTEQLPLQRQPCRLGRKERYSIYLCEQCGNLW
jgi:ADP-L-glycero-D-manno-heptose 6-epimerase